MKTKTNLLAAGIFLAALASVFGQPAAIQGVAGVLRQNQAGPRFRGPLLLPLPEPLQETAGAKTPKEAAAAFPPAEPLPAEAGLRREVFQNIPGATLADLTNHANFPDRPDLVDTVSVFETPSNSGDDYGVRLSGYVVPLTNGSHKFYLSANGGHGESNGFSCSVLWKNFVSRTSLSMTRTLPARTL
jgi:hypothetical protein